MCSVSGVRQTSTQCSNECITSIIDYLMSNLNLESEIENYNDQELDFKAEVSEFDELDLLLTTLLSSFLASCSTLEDLSLDLEDVFLELTRRT